MASILIGYDLKKSGQDYTSLINAIKSIGPNYWHCLDSTWIIKTNHSATAIRDTLSAYVDNNDKLLVIDITGGEAAWRGFNTECSSWLTNNL